MQLHCITCQNKKLFVFTSHLNIFYVLSIYTDCYFSKLPYLAHADRIVSNNCIIFSCDEHCYNLIIFNQIIGFQLKLHWSIKNFSTWNNFLNVSNISGRYNKYSRELPQTPWILDGQRVMPTSVEELMLETMRKAFKFDGKKVFLNHMNYWALVMFANNW